MKLLQMFWIGLVNTFEIEEGQEEAWQKWADDCVEVAAKGNLTQIQPIKNWNGEIQAKLVINNYFLGYRIIDAPKPKETIADEVMRKQSKFFDKMEKQFDPDADEPWNQTEEDE